MSAELLSSWVEYLTNSLATSSASCCAAAGLSPWVVMVTTLPWATEAVTDFCRSVPLTRRPRVAEARSSTTELVATCAWVSSSSAWRGPCSSTLADVS